MIHKRWEASIYDSMKLLRFGSHSYVDWRKIMHCWISFLISNLFNVVGFVTQRGYSNEARGKLNLKFDRKLCRQKNSITEVEKRKQPIGTIPMKCVQLQKGLLKTSTISAVRKDTTPSCFFQIQSKVHSFPREALLWSHFLPYRFALSLT